ASAEASRRRVTPLSRPWRGTDDEWTCLASRRHRVDHDVRDQVRVRIKQDQVAPNEPVLDLLFEWRQRLQDDWRHRRKRHFVRIPGIDAWNDRVRLLADCRAKARALRSSEKRGQRTPDERGHVWSKQIALLCVGPRLDEQLAERALVLVDLLWSRPIRQLRQRRFDFLVQSDVVAHALLEIRDRLLIARLR